MEEIMRQAEARANEAVDCTNLKWGIQDTEENTTGDCRDIVWNSRGKEG